MNLATSHCKHPTKYSNLSAFADGDRHGLEPVGGAFKNPEVADDRSWICMEPFDVYMILLDPSLGR